MGLSFQNRFGCTDNVLDRPERLVDVSYGLGIIDSVSPQHPDTIVALFGFDLFFIDDKVTASFDFEIAAVSLVADQAFVTARAVAPLSVQQSPPDRAHPYGALLHSRQTI